MQLAYYIAVHHNIEQFRWTFSAVYNEADVFVIHVDRKASERFGDCVRGIAQHKNVHFISSQPVAWGGWSVCLAELAGLHTLLSTKSDWSYFINMSGQCYPIKPIEEIRSLLIRAWPHNFIRVVPFSVIAETEPDDPHLKRPAFFEFRGKIRSGRFSWPSNPLVNWKGSMWHILSRPFCEWIIKSGALKSIPLSLRYTFSPDEILFQLLIMNSPFQNAMSEHYGREIIWPGPKVLTVDDWTTLTNSPALFARKFDCRQDEKILRRLAELNRLNMPPG